MYTNKTQNGEDGSRKPRNCNQVTQKLKRAITRDYESWMDGESYVGKSPMYKDALARKYNVSKGAVNYVLREAKKEEVLKMADLYAEGHDVGEIAAKLGKSRKAVKSAIARYNEDPSKFENFDEMKPTILRSNMYDNTEADNKPKEAKQSLFGKYGIKVAAAAAGLLVAAGLACGSASSNKPYSTPKAPTSYTVKAETAPEKAKGLEGTVKVAFSEMKKEEQSQLEDEAETPEIGGDGDDDLPGQYNIGADAYANAAGQVPESQPISDRPMDDKPKPKPEPQPQPTPQPEPQPQPQPTPQPEVKPQPQVSPEDLEDLQRKIKELDEYHKRMSNPDYKPTPQPAPQTKEGLFGEKESGRAYEAEISGKVDFSYGGISGDTSGSQQRGGFEFDSELRSKGELANDSKVHGRLKLGLDYLNQDEKFDLKTGEEVNKKTTAITPWFRLEKENFELGLKFNHAGTSENFDGDSGVSRNFSESGIDYTQTDTESWKQGSDRTIDALDLEARLGGFKARAKGSVDETITKYDNKMLTVVDFANPMFPDLALPNSVDSETSRKTTSGLFSLGYEFKLGGSGLLEPTGIIRHSETEIGAKASLNGDSILDMKDKFSTDTFGGSLLYGTDNFRVKGTLLSNSGDELESSQKTEGAAHLVVAPKEWLTLGAGYGRVNGGNRGMGILKLGGDGSSNLGSVEKFMSKAEEDSLFPEGTLDIQKFYATQGRLMKEGEKGFALYGEGGELNDNGGNYWKLGTAMNLGSVPLINKIPGAGKVELQASYEKDDFGKEFAKDEREAEIFQIGPKVKLTDSIDFGVNYTHTEGNNPYLGGKDGSQNMVGLGLTIKFGGPPKDKR